VPANSADADPGPARDLLDLRLEPEFREHGLAAASTRSRLRRASARIDAPDNRNPRSVS